MDILGRAYLLWSSGNILRIFHINIDYIVIGVLRSFILNCYTRNTFMDPIQATSTDRSNRSSLLCRGR